MDILVSGADVTGRNEGLDVGAHAGPPETSSDEFLCPSGPRMAGKARSVSPLEDLGSERGWDEEAVRGSTPRIGFVFLGLDDLCLDLPGDSA